MPSSEEHCGSVGLNLVTTVVTVLERPSGELAARPVCDGPPGMSAMAAGGADTSSATLSPVCLPPHSLSS